MQCLPKAVKIPLMFIFQTCQSYVSKIQIMLTRKIFTLCYKVLPKYSGGEKNDKYGFLTAIFFLYDVKTFTGVFLFRKSIIYYIIINFMFFNCALTVYIYLIHHCKRKSQLNCGLFVFLGNAKGQNICSL